MWHLCRPPVVRFTRELNTVARAVAALLLAAATLAAPGWAVPIQAAPALPVAAKAPCSVIVNNTFDSGSHSLRDAVACAATSGLVLFTNLANQTITLTSGEIPVTQTMTIDASDSPGVRVDAGGSSRVFNITASGTVTLTGLVLAHGHTNGNGGAVIAANNVVLQQVQVLTSTAGGQGGGLYASATATLSGTQFISNTSGASAGGAQVNGNAVVGGGRFERNMCTGLFCQGGGLNVDGLTLTGTQFISNTSDSAGGGLFANSAAAVTNGLFQGNGCTGSTCQGGGLFANTTLALTGTQVLSNTSLGNGGAVYANLAAVLTNGLFQGNLCDDADCQGGGLFTNDALTLSGTQLINNGSHGDGGGVYANLAVGLTNGRFQDNYCHTGCQGGGLFTNASLTLNGTQLIGNLSSDGGGAYVAGTAALTNGLFQGNQCSLSHCQGGGLDAAGLTLTGTRFISNTSLGSGGGASIGLGGAVLTNGLFQGNHCNGGSCQGGGLYDGAGLMLTGTQFISNTSRTDGGGAYTRAQAVLTNGRFAGNGCGDSGCTGGGLYVKTTLALTGTQFISNTSLGNGAGAYAGSETQLNGGLFQGNICDQEVDCLGGGLYAATNLTLTGTQFITNAINDGGGGAYVGSTALLTNGLFQGNRCASTCQGGGLSAFDATITGTQFIGNSSSSGDGGGVYILGTATVTNGRFEGNTCISSGCRGAGLYANTTGLVQASSFSANHAGGSGGALAGTAVTLANVTLSGNSADVSGGALFALSGSMLNLYNVTVADNQAPSGPGLLAQAGSTVGINNTIFANNGAANCTGPIANGTHNLQWPDSTCAGAGFTTADPQLLPLALNAPGTTLTRALGPASPARDHGDAATCAAAPVNNHDQRGVVRPLNSDLIAGAICDIGTFEAAAPLWQLFLPLVRR